MIKKLEIVCQKNGSLWEEVILWRKKKGKLKGLVQENDDALKTKEKEFACSNIVLKKFGGKNKKLLQADERSKVEKKKACSI